VRSPDNRFNQFRRNFSPVELTMRYAVTVLTLSLSMCFFSLTTSAFTLTCHTGVIIINSSSTSFCGRWRKWWQYVYF